MTIFQMIFENWSLPIVVFDRDLNIIYCNHAYEKAVRKQLSDMSGRHVFDVFPESEDRVASVRDKFLLTLGGTPTSLDRTRFNLIDENGVTSERVWQATMEPFYDAHGQISHIIQRVDDVTEMVQAQLERRLIKEELDHRMKNIHTVIQAMVRLSSRSADSIDEFRDSFLGRLRSMSRSHDRLLRAGMMSVSLEKLLADEIMGVAPDRENAVSLKGPPVFFSPNLSRSFSMLTHELATNAVKYGCFSQENGYLSVSWQTIDDILHMIWREDGLKNLTPPKKTGFGSKMIRMLPGIEYETNYRPNGLEVIVALPLLNSD